MADKHCGISGVNIRKRLMKDFPNLHALKQWVKSGKAWV